MSNKLRMFAQAILPQERHKNYEYNYISRNQQKQDSIQ